MRKKNFLHLCLFVPVFLAADGYEDRGFYGGLDFLYMEDDYTMSSSRTTQDSFTQELKIGYIGNIYSPRLLEYVVEGRVRYDDIKTQSNGIESKQESEGINYKTKFDFIKATKFPFSVYANKSERPVSTVYSVYSQEYINETKSEGATGRIDFNPYIFQYGATTTENITESSGSLQSLKMTNYTGSFSYKESVHSLMLNYARNIEENQQYYIGDTTRNLDRVKDVLNLSYNWSGIEDLALSGGASYENDDYFSSQVIDADLNMYWRPKGEKYDTSFSIFGSNMEYGDGIESEKYIFNSINLNQTFNYKLTENINLSESAMAYIYDATTVKGTNTNINLFATHNYATTFFENIPFTLTTSAGAQKNDTDSQSTAVIGTTTTSMSVERYSLNLNARAKRELPSIKSSLNFDSSYYNSISSNDEEEQRYSAGLYLLSKLSRMVNNNISARYTKSDRVMVSYLNDEQMENSYSTSSLSESINFNYDIGQRGMIRLGVGVEYTNMKNDTETTSEINPRADASMNYRLFNSWNFSASARVSEAYNTVNNSGSANLNFKAGKTTFLMGYQYNKSQVESVFNKIQNERSVFRAQLTREF